MIGPASSMLQPTVVSPYRAPAGYGPASGAPSVSQQLINQLGRYTFMGPDGILRFNEPLLQALVARREEAVPALIGVFGQWVRQPQANLNAILEGLQAAERLAESGIRAIGELYPVVSVLNTHPNPLLQIYLAGFYRHINRPETFGPMLSTLIHHSVRQYPQSHTSINPTEEVGGTLLQQIANRTADETVKRLLPYLQPNPQVPSFVSPPL